MTLFLCMIISSLAALACTPALVSCAPRRNRRSRAGTALSMLPASEADSSSIADRVRQTRLAIREAETGQRRLVEVSKIVEESNDVISVYLTSVDESVLPDFRPGQHLIIERPSAVNVVATSRCYTLSNSPQQKPWRITVRRMDSTNDWTSVSNWIHRELRVGDRLRVRGPRGSFTLDKADAAKPVVFAAAGVGVTPMASMLHEELSYARSRPKWFFYQVRTWDAAPLLQELVTSIEQSQSCKAWIAASRDAAPSTVPMKRVRLLEGKLNSSAMMKAVGTTDATVFLCGPHNWMLEMRRSLEELGVPDDQIHDEAFGVPESTEVIHSTTGSDEKNNETRFDVAFESSGKNASFCSEQGDLLSLAKAQSVHIPASCRKGNCGTCAIKLLRGTVEYLRVPEATTAEGEILPCICIPTSDIAVQA